MPNHHIIISASLRTGSRSRLLALEAQRQLEEKGESVEFLDLAQTPLPLCDGGACYSDERVQAVKAALVKGDGFLLATPIYNFDVNAALKNLIELTGRDVWTDKVVGFLCAAGGHSSYMSVSGLAADLMLDFRTFVIPRFVYATGSDFEDHALASPDLETRLEQLCSELVRVTAALQRD